MLRYVLPVDHLPVETPQSVVSIVFMWLTIGAVIGLLALFVRTLRRRVHRIHGGYWWGFNQRRYRQGRIERKWRRDRFRDDPEVRRHLFRRHISNKHSDFSEH